MPDECSSRRASTAKTQSYGGTCHTFETEDNKKLTRAKSVAQKKTKGQKRRPFSIGRGLRVVLTQTGFNELDQAALRRAKEECRRLKKAHVSLVQNDPLYHGIVKAATSKDVVVGCMPNEGFAAACNHGAYDCPVLGTPDFEWLLFTQSDAVWSAVDVEDALSMVQEYGVPYPVVGPSGGYVCDPLLGVVREVGRNDGLRSCRDLESIPVDWIAGFWVLVHRDAFEAIGGWDEGFFLYYEDPDLCLRLAMNGHRSFVLPQLQISHQRGTTIKKRFSSVTFRWFQQRSKKRFVAKWG
jgi:hypothetical protein